MKNCNEDEIFHEIFSHIDLYYEKKIKSIAIAIPNKYGRILRTGETIW